MGDFNEQDKIPSKYLGITGLGLPPGADGSLLIYNVGTGEWEPELLSFDVRNPSHTFLVDTGLADQHPIAAITGLQAALNALIGGGAHTHDISDINNLQSILDDIDSHDLNSHPDVIISGLVDLEVLAFSQAANGGLGAWINIDSATLTSTGDNLGNHIATQDLNMDTFKIIGLGAGVDNTDAVTVQQLYGQRLQDHSNVDILGLTNGELLQFNGTNWVNIPTSSLGGDNLGNHIATQTLNMAGYEITNIGNPTGNDSAISLQYALNLIQSTYLNTLLDVDTSGKQDGDNLQWNETSSKWEAVSSSQPNLIEISSDEPTTPYVNKLWLLESAVPNLQHQEGHLAICTLLGTPAFGMDNTWKSISDQTNINRLNVAYGYLCGGNDYVVDNIKVIDTNNPTLIDIYGVLNTQRESAVGGALPNTHAVVAGGAYTTVESFPIRNGSGTSSYVGYISITRYDAISARNNDSLFIFGGSNQPTSYYNSRVGYDSIEIFNLVTYTNSMTGNTLPDEIYSSDSSQFGSMAYYGGRTTIFKFDTTLGTAVATAASTSGPLGHDICWFNNQSVDRAYVIPNSPHTNTLHRFDVATENITVLREANLGQDQDINSNISGEFYGITHRNITGTRYIEYSTETDFGTGTGAGYHSSNAPGISAEGIN